MKNIWHIHKARKEFILDKTTKREEEKKRNGRHEINRAIEKESEMQKHE